MAHEQPTVGPTIDDNGRPRLIFTTERDGPALLGLLAQPGLIDLLVTQGYGVALALPRLDEPRVTAARLLTARGVPLVAWLRLPVEEGFAFNAQNYPRALACYQTFRAWALTHQLTFEAVGLEMAPPSELLRTARPSLPWALRRLRNAHDSALYLAARAAYLDLVTSIRNDGYELHTYQIPLVADDRRIGTTLVQRVLDVVDLPTDLDVLLCSSGIPVELLDGDLGGALVASYGPDADAIGVGSSADDGEQPLPWPALRRDLLLAAQHTDVVYVDSLEMCASQGLLPQIAALDWGMQLQVAPGRQALLVLFRCVMLLLLAGSRFGLRALAWTGWLLAAALWLNRKRLGTRD